MKKISVYVQKEFCAECSLALMRFMQNMDGIESFEAGDGVIWITFNEAMIEEERVREIARENIGKLGYKSL